MPGSLQFITVPEQQRLDINSPSLPSTRNLPQDGAPKFHIVNGQGHKKNGSTSAAGSGKKRRKGSQTGSEEDDSEEDSDDEDKPREKNHRKRNATSTGRRKIQIEYIEEKNKRHVSFTKRKSGLMKKGYELSTLTGTECLILVVSESGQVYSYATPQLRPIIETEVGKEMIAVTLRGEMDSMKSISQLSASAATTEPAPPQIQNPPFLDTDLSPNFQLPTMEQSRQYSSMAPPIRNITPMHSMDPLSDYMSMMGQQQPLVSKQSRQFQEQPFSNFQYNHLQEPSLLAQHNQTPPKVGLDRPTRLMDDVSSLVDKVALEQSRAYTNYTQATGMPVMPANPVVSTWTGESRPSEPTRPNEVRIEEDAEQRRERFTRERIEMANLCKTTNSLLSAVQAHRFSLYLSLTIPPSSSALSAIQSLRFPHGSDALLLRLQAACDFEQFVMDREPAFGLQDLEMALKEFTDHMRRTRPENQVQEAKGLVIAFLDFLEGYNIIQTMDHERLVDGYTHAKYPVDSSWNEPAIQNTYALPEQSSGVTTLNLDNLDQEPKNENTDWIRARKNKITGLLGKHMYGRGPINSKVYFLTTRVYRIRKTFCLVQVEDNQGTEEIPTPFKLRLPPYVTSELKLDDCLVGGFERFYHKGNEVWNLVQLAAFEPTTSSESPEESDLDVSRYEDEFNRLMMLPETERVGEYDKEVERVQFTMDALARAQRALDDGELTE